MKRNCKPFREPWLTSVYLDGFVLLVISDVCVVWCVFLCIVFPVFLDCLALIGSSVFCKVYLHNMGVLEKTSHILGNKHMPPGEIFQICK